LRPWICDHWRHSLLLLLPYIPSFPPQLRSIRERPLVSVHLQSYIARQTSPQPIHIPANNKMFPPRITTLLLAALTATICLAAPAPPQYPLLHVTVPQSHFEVLRMRQLYPLEPRAVTDTECIDRNAHIVFHDQNAAELSICGGIAGSVKRCQGGPSMTQGRVGSALFTLKAVDEGKTINLTKKRWEQCVRAARAVCPTGSLSATCLGGASRGGDVQFSLIAM
jgi:hypothetical protein